MVMTPGADFAAAAVLFSSCLALIFIDFDFQILPDSITIPLLLAGVAIALGMGSLVAAVALMLVRLRLDDAN